MENNLEQYNSKRHKIFILWEYTKQLLGFINTLENRTVNLEKQIKSLNVGTNKSSSGLKKVEVALSSFSNLTQGCSTQQTKGNTILTLIFPSGSWDATVILITYTHNLNIISDVVFADLQLYFTDVSGDFGNAYNRLSSNYIYSRDNNSITIAIPGSHQFTGYTYNISNAKLRLLY